jgi:hypothetical protein
MLRNIDSLQVLNLLLTSRFLHMVSEENQSPGEQTMQDIG